MWEWLVMVGIAGVMFGAGFVVCACFGMGQVYDLRQALARLVADPLDERVRQAAEDVLRG